ncbi:MAG: TolC family protein [Syntrophorhabdaceae bacterium]|nr:TolC family protein [Syntrophorhabdaceae bacterium]MDD4197029.1 TolC family protein [Syntrophorhabdaceae bacterium]
MKIPPVLFLVIGIILATLLPYSASAGQDPPGGRLDLPALIDYAIKHNPALKIAKQNIDIEGQGVKAAEADRMPRIDVTGGYTRYRYDNPLTPIVIERLPLLPSDIPDFEKNVYDGFATFSVPLFKGGRLVRGVTIAELKRSMARDYHTRNLHELIYNVTAVYYKLAQLNELLKAFEAQEMGLEAHRRDVEFFLKAGTSPKLDLFKADVELAGATERRIQTRNTIANTRELLRSIIGMDDPGELPVSFGRALLMPVQVPRGDLDQALSNRPDYRAALNKVKMFEERVASARGKRLPDVYASGDYGGRAGDSFAFKENWTLGVRFMLPVFDFGRISSEVGRERYSLMNAKEEERALRLTIAREIRDAQTAISNAEERITVSEKAITSAKEQARIEDLRYKAGDNTSTDVINAQTALVRSRSDHSQALFDRQVAVASLVKAMGSTDRPESAPGLEIGARNGAKTAIPATQEVR